ncbi:MAG: Holliday junction branch migration protein RuvA, partial [Pseudomonadota bacterium]
RTLQGVQGVGAKVALAVLGVLAPDELANAIAIGDWAAVGQTPGVGKRIAQRIVTELKDKAPALSMAGLSVPSKEAGAITSATAISDRGNNAAAEAISALCNLGYQPAQASQAVAMAARELGENPDTAQLIRSSLKALSR